MVMETSHVRASPDYSQHDCLGMVFTVPNPDFLTWMNTALEDALRASTGSEALASALGTAFEITRYGEHGSDKANEGEDPRYALWGDRIVWRAVPSVEQLLPVGYAAVLMIETWSALLRDNGVALPQLWHPELTAATVAGLVARHASHVYNIAPSAAVTYSIRRSRLHASAVVHESHEFSIGLRAPFRQSLLYICDGRGRVTLHIDAHGHRTQWDDCPNLFAHYPPV
jgi:hypothetical protein